MEAVQCMHIECKQSMHAKPPAARLTEEKIIVATEQQLLFLTNREKNLTTTLSLHT